jgi:hypothetical protein
MISLKSLLQNYRAPATHHMRDQVRQQRIDVTGSHVIKLK